MNPEKILKQIRDNRDAEYSLIVAMAGCLSRLINVCDKSLNHPDDYRPTQMVIEIEEAKRLLNGENFGPTFVKQDPISGRIKPYPDKPVMRSG